MAKGVGEELKRFGKRAERVVSKHAKQIEEAVKDLPGYGLYQDPDEELKRVFKPKSDEDDVPEAPAPVAQRSTLGARTASERSLMKKRGLQKTKLVRRPLGGGASLGGR